MNKNVFRLLIVAVPVLIIFVSTYFIALPMMDTAAANEGILKTKELELMMEEGELSALDSVESIEELNTVYDVLENQIPSELNDTRLLSEIEKIYSNNKIDVNNISIRSSESVETNGSISYPVEIDGKATMKNLEKFIKDLQNASRLIVINELSLSTSSDNGEYAFKLVGSIFTS